METTEEFFARMDAEDELDAAREGITKMTVIEYAKARKMQPQLLYYYVRSGKLSVVLCECGRKCINIKEADAFFVEKDRKRSGIVLEVSDGEDGID